MAPVVVEGLDLVEANLHPGDRAQPHLRDRAPRIAGAQDEAERGIVAAAGIRYGPAVGTSVVVSQDVLNT
jgi:hypothetical protein